MAQKITWQEPDEIGVTQTEISRSNTIYGSYAVIDTINATSDGLAKSSSNTWVTTYTDTTGSRTHWFKIRFYDGTQALWSGFSEPITSEQLFRLCTVAEVKVVLTTTGRWTDDEVFDKITEADDLIYIESGTPIQAMWSVIGKIDSTIQTRYYVGEENIYRTDRVFYGTTTKTELFLDDGYRANNKHGMVEILPVGSSGITPEVTSEIEVQFVPSIYNQLSKYRTAKLLLEGLDFTSGGSASKELATIENKLVMVEQLLANRIGLQLSSSVKYYDGAYGVNMHRVVQNHDRNRYVGSTGW